MKKEYITPEITVVDIKTEEVTTLSNQSGRSGTNVLASWLIGE